MPVGTCPSLATADLKLLNIGDTRLVAATMEQLKDSSGIKVRTFCRSQLRNQQQVDDLLSSYLEDTDLLIVSEDHPFAISAVREAFRRGVPVLAVASEETKRLINHSCGFPVVADGDVVASVAVTIRRVRTQPFILMPMRSGARQRSGVCNVWR